MSEKICSVSPKEVCAGCDLNTSLMCRYEARDTLHFFMIILPLFVTAIGGMIVSGYGWWLFGWLGYMLLFFFGWEARVLCSHCPYWSEDGRILHCHANYGAIKLWRYRPGPMSRSEGIQFLIGVFLFVLYPLIFLVIGHQYLLAGIGVASAVSFIYLLRRNICSRCVNFSCPLNNVPKPLIDEYLKHNPIMKKAWQEKGYK